MIYITKLDFTLPAEERNKVVEKIISETPPEKLSPKFLSYLSDYIIKGLPREELHQKYILTDNRLVTIKKYETSYENLISKLAGAEDSLYPLISDAGKGTILCPKKSITPTDLAQVPSLQNLSTDISVVSAMAKKASGKAKYALKKQEIEMRQDQYVLKDNYHAPLQPHTSTILKNISRISLYDDIHFDAEGNPYNNGPISLFNPKHIEAILHNYEDLRNLASGDYENDLWYLLEDLDSLIDVALQPHPYLNSILLLKIQKLSNKEIQAALHKKYPAESHSDQYISSCWRKRIPKLIAEEAQKQYLIWYYTEVEYGKWKRCCRCGKVKLAHSKFFSKNNTSKDGFYSMCKECRNKKKK